MLRIVAKTCEYVLLIVSVAAVAEHIDTYLQDGTALLEMACRVRASANFEGLGLSLASQSQ